MLVKKFMVKHYLKILTYVLKTVAVADLLEEMAAEKQCFYELQQVICL